MPTEIEARADELRAIAAKCATLQEFWKATGFKDVQAAHRANEVLKLYLPIIRKSGRTGPPKEAQSCPKPTGKGKS